MRPPAGDIREAYLNEKVLFYRRYSITIHQSVGAALHATVDIKHGIRPMKQVLIYYNICIACKFTTRSAIIIFLGGEGGEGVDEHVLMYWLQYKQCHMVAFGQAFFSIY